MLQLELRNAFADVAKILVPSEAGLTILKGTLPSRDEYNSLFHDRLRPRISHHSICSVITAHNLTPVERDG